MFKYLSFIIPAVLIVVGIGLLEMTIDTRTSSSEEWVQGIDKQVIKAGCNGLAVLRTVPRFREKPNGKLFDWAKTEMTENANKIILSKLNELESRPYRVVPSNRSTTLADKSKRLVVEVGTETGCDCVMIFDTAITVSRSSSGKKGDVTIDWDGRVVRVANMKTIWSGVYDSGKLPAEVDHIFE